jgi:hypothetical protein
MSSCNRSTGLVFLFQVFSDEEETQLVAYIKQAAKLHYGLTLKQVRNLAFELAAANNKDIPAKWKEEQLAGENWLRGFRSRHPSISLRTPEATSMARATAFNRAHVEGFFNNLIEVMEKHKFPPQAVWNMDESGCSTVHNPPKVLAEKGTKQLGSMTSGERGVNVTLIAAINAAGNSVPPCFVFPRVFFKEHMLKGAPPGSIGVANPSGWSNSEIFLTYLDHFIKFTKPSENDIQLLILDNHESHVSISAIQKAKDNHIIMLTLPPHTSHKLQPLDRSVFGPFKTFYSKAMAEFLLTNNAKPVTIYDVCQISDRAYELAFTLKNIVSGFRVTGIFPVNRDVFGDDDFLPSSVTDRPEQSEIVDKPSCSSAPSDSTFSSGLLPPSASSSGRPTSGAVTLKSPEEVRPFPKAGERKPSNRRRVKSQILTSTPVKTQIEAERAATGIKRRKKGKKIQFDSEEEEEVVTQQEVERQEENDESDDAASISNLEDDDECSFFEENPVPVLGCWVLVEFVGKKTNLYYVGQVTQIENAVITVNFLKKGKKQYVFPTVKDESTINFKQIKKVMPEPNVRRGYYSFQIKLPQHLNFV